MAGTSRGESARRRDLSRIGGPLGDLLERLHLVKPMRGWKALSLWGEVVGERVGQRTQAVAFRDGTLIVEVATSSWMAELTYLKRRIIQDLNKRIGEEVVQEIQLRPALNTGGAERHKDS